GLIRVARFREDQYPDVCIEQWRKHRHRIRAHCDVECQRDFAIRYVSNALIQEFQRALENLKSLHIDALLVDVTENARGTDWEGAVARVLTPRPLICGSRGFIRHPHHGLRLTCDRSGIWKNPKQSANCPLVEQRMVKDCAPDPIYQYRRGLFN